MTTPLERRRPPAAGWRDGELDAGPLHLEAGCMACAVAAVHVRRDTHRVVVELDAAATTTLAGVLR